MAEKKEMQNQTDAYLTETLDSFEGIPGVELTSFDQLYCQAPFLQKLIQENSQQSLPPANLKFI